MFKIAIGECESDLGDAIELQAPQYLEDRIGKTLAQEIDLATHRIEVTGSPEHTLLETRLIGESFERNFIFFHDRQSPMDGEALIGL